MLAVFELLLAWYRFGFLGRSPTPLDSQHGSSSQSFLSIATVAWFQENSWPEVQNAFAPISKASSSNSYFMSKLYFEIYQFTGKSMKDQNSTFASFDLFLFMTPSRAAVAGF